MLSRREPLRRFFDPLLGTRLGCILGVITHAVFSITVAADATHGSVAGVGQRGRIRPDGVQLCREEFPCNFKSFCCPFVFLLPPFHVVVILAKEALVVGDASAAGSSRGVDGLAVVGFVELDLLSLGASTFDGRAIC